MVQKIQYFCDICQKECLVQDGLGTFSGFIVKMNTDLKAENVGFTGHYCNECCEKILNFIGELSPKNV